ncbi:MAG: tripartite-type tricarboxylate transporter receptor subunit TctC [Alphaproteobacteria bacterium]
MKGNTVRRISPFQIALAIVFAAYLVSFSPIGATAQETSFAGKRVTVIIGTSPGGGTGTSTRLIGRFLSKYLPGKPQMIYRYMPAGGGVQATNYFANDVARNGTAWMGGGGPYIGAVTLRKDGIKYNPTTFNFLGGISRGGSILMIANKKFANLTDATKPPVVVGATPGLGGTVELLSWAAEHANWNLKFVVGYPGTGSLYIALKRGEIDAMGTSNLSILKPLLKDADFMSFIQTGDMQDGKVVPRAGFGKVPLITDLVAGKLSGIAAETFEYWIRADQIDKWYALPPRTPSNIVKTYAAAFKKMSQDPKFKKDGKALFGPGFIVQTAADLANIVATTSYPSAKKRDYIQNMMKKWGLPTEPLSEAEKKALAKKLVKLDSVTVTLAKVLRQGRSLHFTVGAETHKVRVSSSRSKVTIAGKKAKRAKIRAGMTCKIAYAGNGAVANTIDCR